MSLTAEKAQKILNQVPYEKGFHFFSPDGHYTGETATSLSAFLKDLDRIDTQSVRFHFERGDFQKWINDVIGDNELADKIAKIDKKVSEESLNRTLAEMTQKRISQLQLIRTQSP